jgi:hypothetical protein
MGPPANVEVGHINGHEEDDAPANLFWTYRSCNVLSGNTLRARSPDRKENPGDRLDSANDPF